MAKSKSARLNLRIPEWLKKDIVKAAGQRKKSMNRLAISMLRDAMLKIK